MYEGISVAAKVTMTEVMKGRMFLMAMRPMDVPKHREARLYSRSRIIMTWVRIKYATPSQPVTVKHQGP